MIPAPIAAHTPAPLPPPRPPPPPPPTAAAGSDALADRLRAAGASGNDVAALMRALRPPAPPAEED